MAKSLWKYIALLPLIGSCSSSPDDSAVVQRSAALLDTSVCPPGSNIILGTAGPDVLQGTNGPDCILGGDGDDRLEGSNGNDVLVGGAGNDILLGGNGDDLLDGGDGDDQLDGGNGRDTLKGGPGNDILLGGYGDDTLKGDAGNDVLVGNNGADILQGGDGDDVIDAGNGNGSVSGGNGQDACTGTGCEAASPGVTACTADAQCGSQRRCAPSGICVGCLADFECDDGNVCIADSCQPALGCRRLAVPNGTACLDDHVCNGAERCQSGTCVPGPTLSCDDGLFCNGSETCDAVAGCVAGTPPVVTSDDIPCTVDRCNEDTDSIEHVPNDAACSAGFFCGQLGCANINECETGQNDCSPDATCTDETPGGYCDDYICGNRPPFYCHCKRGYEGDGRTCAPVCDPLTVASGVERCVRSRPDQTVDLRFTRIDQPWKEEFDRNDEKPFVNYCGPTAVKNFLFWYGSDVEYPDIGSEMSTNTWDTGPVVGAVFALGPSVGCFDPLISCLLVAKLVADFALQLGTLPGDMRAALARRAPPGYTACLKSFDPDFESVRSSLAAGNPVVYLESEGGTLHWAVATGLYHDFRSSELKVRIANSNDREWNQFVTDWSLTRIGLWQPVLAAAFGLNPYTMIRWIPADQAVGFGDRCP